MVKRLDEQSEGIKRPVGRAAAEPGLPGHAAAAALPEHVGWLLWRAGNLWLARFVDEMQGAGHDWFGPAQARLLGYIERRGVSQRALVEKAPMTKQAVNQLLTELEREGVIVRVPDLRDRRARVVRFTKKGLAALADADRIKGEIESELAEAMSLNELAGTKRRLVALARVLNGDG